MITSQLAFVFPGQGSQKVGMLASHAAADVTIQATFAEASEVLGYDLWALSQQGPQEDLNLTERTQPVLLTAGVALWRRWREWGGATPALLAGHSLGEFTALVCADVIRFGDAVELVRKRGAFMQSAVPVGVGAMAAIIGLDDADIAVACATSAQGECVAPVNYNSPGQVVIAGHAAAVERASAACKAAGAKRALPLPVSAPFHTELMKPAGQQLAQALRALEFKAPAIPVVHNVNARPETDPGAIKALLVEQIHSPVLWTGCVAYMLSQGIQLTLECGPGSVLSGLNRRIEKSLQAASLDEPDTMEKALALVADYSV